MIPRSISLTIGVLLFVSLSMSALGDDKQYKLGPDSQLQDSVPQGKVTQHEWRSKIFPDTVRRYWVYTPANHDKQKATALMVFQDGHTYVDPKGQFRATVVMDNLIHKKEIPSMIGLFIDPGHKKDELPPKPGWRPTPENRSFEYDTLSDQYARFLLEEMIPELAKEHKLAESPDQRAICGISSGGICAWTVAWQRPDSFRKVLSHVGSFTNIRGGHVYPAIIRKTDLKPIRVFLQDGSGDLDNAHGNWPLANQQMAKSLAYAKYDYRFEYGEGGHNGIHGGAILPEAMRWLWRSSD